MPKMVSHFELYWQSQYSVSKLSYINDSKGQVKTIAKFILLFQLHIPLYFAGDLLQDLQRITRRQRTHGVY